MYIYIYIYILSLGVDAAARAAAPPRRAATLRSSRAPRPASEGLGSPACLCRFTGVHATMFCKGRLCPETRTPFAVEGPPSCYAGSLVEGPHSNNSNSNNSSNK